MRLLERIVEFLEASYRAWSAARGSARSKEFNCGDRDRTSYRGERREGRTPRVTAREIAARLNARSVGDGKWVARCRAHDDRHPSLAIAEGRDGRTLLRCFKGCEVAAIVHAVGLSLGDLFDGTPIPIRPAPHRPTADELCLALAIEERSLRERRVIQGLLRTSEINAIRATVSKRYLIELAPIARPLYEGGFGGRERDPAWPAIFEWALLVASVQLLGAAIAFDETQLPPTAILIEAEHLAALAMRDVEREARRSAKPAA